MSHTAVLLVAAGKSSRMGCFKPLMDLAGMPLIDHTLGAFRTVDIKETVVVTGYRGDELEAHFRSKDVKLLHNSRYAETEMIDSLQIGLRYLQHKCDRVFIMPSDIPLVQPFTIEVLSGLKTDKPLVQPAFNGRHGHPILVSAACVPDILQFHGEGGLRSALKGFEKESIDIPDPGIRMDADTPEAFAQITACHEALFIPSRELALAMLEWYAGDERIIRHCKAVANVAQEIALRAEKRGHQLNLRLIEAGALLHDICRKRHSDHALAAFDLLNRLGYPEVGRVAVAHMDLPPDALTHIDERAVVYLADKLVQGDNCVGLNARFDHAMEKYKDDSSAAAAIKKRMDDAITVMQKLGLSEEECSKIGSNC